MTYDTLLVEERPGVLAFGGVRMAMLDIAAGFWGLRRQMEALAGPRLTDAVLQQAGANGGASFARAFASQKGNAQALRDCIAAYQAAGFGQFEIEALDWPFGFAQGRSTGRVLVRAQEAFEAWTVQQYSQSPKSPVCAYTAGVLVGFVNALAGRQDVVCIERTCQAQGAESCLFELLPAEVAGDTPVIAYSPDPALGRQINLLEILFDRMPMGIVIFDRDLRIRRFNPTWVEFIARHSAASPAQVVPGLSFFELIPGTETDTWPIFERVLAGETVRQHAFRLETGGAVSYWDAVISPLTEGDRVVGIVHVTTDVTERVRIHQELEQRVKERTHELATLLQVSRDVNSTLELQPLLELILDQLKKVVAYSGASILTLEGSDLIVRAYRGPIPTDEARHLRFPLERALVNREVIRQREPLVIPDVRSDAPLARVFRQTAGSGLDSTFGYVRSWLGVPLLVKGEPLGMLTLDHSRPGFFTVQHADLVLTFANQVAVAIENARLLQAEQQQLDESERRRRVAEGLRDLLAILNSDRSLPDVLDFLVEQARGLLGAAAAMIRRADFERQVVTTEASSRLPAGYDLIRVTPLYHSESDKILMARQPVIVPDLRAVYAAALEQDTAVDGLVRSALALEMVHFRSLLMVPLFIQNQIYGSLRFYFAEVRVFSDEDVQLAMMLSDHAALAIENARLRAQAEASAVAAERNRLARDLHDAVTQTLFSSSLIAEVLPRLWERNPDEGQRRLAELRELTRGALAEMRTLLLELRPAALVEASLADLLRQLAESITGRARVPVAFELEGECELEAEVKVALYRIAQEALNNVAKHAGASRATVSLRCEPGQVDLHIRDDGIGFDPGGLAPNSLGLGIMRERAEAIGAELKADSRPGTGTLIEVVWRSVQ